MYNFSINETEHCMLINGYMLCVVETTIIFLATSITVETEYTY